METVTLKRIVHYRFGPDNNWRTTPGFEAWENGVEDVWRRNTYIAVPWQPSPQNVEYILLFSAGQQAKNRIFESAAVTTGQQKDWRKEFRGDIYRESSSVEVDSKSMAGQILQEDIKPFHSRNTLLILVFKSGLQVQVPPGQKQLIMQAYYDWVSGLTASFKNVKMVSLCGTSRGGVLATRLAKEIRERRRDKISELRVLVISLDGVPNHYEREIDSTDTRVINLLAAERPNNEEYWYGYLTNLQNYFSSELRENLFMYQTIGGEIIGRKVGDEYIPIPFGIFHGFCSGNDIEDAQINHFDTDFIDDGFDENQLQNNGELWGFYNQVWVNKTHKEIGSDDISFARNEVAKSHLKWIRKKTSDLWSDGHIWTWPYVHDLADRKFPHIWILSDASENDIRVMKDSPTDSETEDLPWESRIYVQGEPIEFEIPHGQQPLIFDKDLNAFGNVIVRKKLGYISTPVYTQFETVNLTEPVTVNCRTIRGKLNGAGVFVEEVQGEIEQVNDLSRQLVFNGFQDDDYRQNAVVRFKVVASDADYRLSTDTCDFYAKSLLIVFHPIKIDMQQLLYPEVETYLLAALQEELTSLPAFQRKNNVEKSAILNKVKTSINSTWHKLKDQPKMLARLELSHQKMQQTAIQECILRIATMPGATQFNNSLSKLESNLVKGLVENAQGLASNAVFKELESSGKLQQIFDDIN